MKYHKNLVKITLLIIFFLAMPYFALAASYGIIQGTVTDAITGEPIVDAIIKLDSSVSASRPPDGGYTIMQETGLWHMTVEAEGYCTVNIDMELRGNETIRLNIQLNDINTDGNLDLADAITALQVIAGMKPDTVCLAADVNGDNKIGLEEAVYVIRNIAIP